MGFGEEGWPNGEEWPNGDGFPNGNDLPKGDGEEGGGGPDGPNALLQRLYLSLPSLYSSLSVKENKRLKSLSDTRTLAK